VSETYSAELYRQEGDNFRSVRLSVYADGSVRLDAQDMGKVVSGSQTNRALAQSVRAFWLSTSSNRDPGEVTTAVRIRVVWRGFFSVGALCKDRENGVLHGAGAHTG
jgi:hypothetical protein